MSDTPGRRPHDWPERQKAVDITRSCIVQAPAGSGKTELLVQRILALLAVAECPEEILSITFTRKAAGEMRLRLLQSLERGRDATPPEEPHAVETWRRARAVLARDRSRGWSLLDNPLRLQLLTIDSFCAFLTRRMPWLARFGDQPQVTDDPDELYQAAAEALLAQLDQGGDGQDAVEQLLVHLDNRLALLRDLLVAMLGRRDQWLRHLIERRDQSPRQVLETGLQLYIEAALRHVRTALGQDTCTELWEVFLGAADNLVREQSDHPYASLLQADQDPDSLDQWLAMAHLVLTTSSEVRKTINRANGFPATATEQAQALKSRALALLDHFRDEPGAVHALQALRRLPSARYANDQWPILQALIELLPLAVVELRQVFQRAGRVDFIEIAGAARIALGSVAQPEELLLQLDSRLRHILVDEFQDTSFAQYELLRCLTAGWQADDGRTLFLVGDPMQSIYRFREAEVGLYLRVCQRGLDSLPMERILLHTNFRSQKPLVEWVNEHFSGLFPTVEDEVLGAVPFAQALAHGQQEGGASITLHAFVDRQDQAEADRVVELIRQARQVQPEGTIAILVRSRSHLQAIVGALKRAELPYQAQDIDPLDTRPVALDLLSLARALTHPADRVAWLSVLRAPWCGLSLDDLEKLCRRDNRATVWQLLTEPDDQVEMFDRLSADGRQRLSRILPALELGLGNRGRMGLRQLVESTWLAMNGPACVEEADLNDARQVLALFGQDDDQPLERLAGQLGKLFAAPDPRAGPELQLMTIHKAKGLEFDTVILPGLGRGVRARERALLRWLEHPDYELLLAPIPPLSGDQQEPTYRAIGHILQDKDDLETLRLLYVAVTRAKSRLHLLGHARLARDSQMKPAQGSLLAVAWPALHVEFAARAVAAETSVAKEKSPVKIRRLPLSWQAPAIPSPLVVDSRHVRLASAGGHYKDAPWRSRRTEEGRVIGILVHLWLEQIARDGVSRWPLTAIRGLTGQLGHQLRSEGIPGPRLESCTRVILGCLTSMVGSDRGRWLLGDHLDAACELPLNGMVDGQMVHASIDRTFVDADQQVRWVVDYKTGSPASEEDKTLFMKEEMDRYADQLQLYATLVNQLKSDGLPVRAALYFPAFDGWLEMEKR